MGRERDMEKVEAPKLVYFNGGKCETQNCKPACIIIQKDNFFCGTKN